jgi:hypothetical protein
MAGRVDRRLASIVGAGRFAATVRDRDGHPVRLDLLRLGHLEMRRRCGQRLTKVQREALSAANETSSGGEGCTRGIIVAYAAEIFAAHCEQQVRVHGGRIVRGHGDDRTVERFPVRRESNPRPRGAGRPAGAKSGTARTGRGGDSGDNSDEPEPGPRSGRPKASPDGPVALVPRRYWRDWACRRARVVAPLLSPAWRPA